MKALYELKEILEDEVKNMTKKGDITPQELENAYKITDILKDIETIKAMKEAGEQGQYSRAYDYARDGGSYDGNYSQRMYYDGGNSMNSYNNSMNYSQARRGRDGDGDGRYSEDNSFRRYSRHSEKDKMIDQLNNLMMNAQLSDREKAMVKDCISQLDK